MQSKWKKDKLYFKIFSTVNSNEIKRNNIGVFGELKSTCRAQLIKGYK